MIKLYNSVANNLTPIKMVALTVLLLGVFDNLTSPLQHAQNQGNLEYEVTFIEWIVRILFLFCGIFGLMGNGKTKRMRATVVSLPLLYLSAFSFFMLIEYSNAVLFIPFILSGVPGVWTLLFGDNYE